MNSIRAVLFDLDNTLYENDEALEEWARDRALKLIPSEQSERLIGVMPEVLEHLTALKLTEQDPTVQAAYDSTLSRLIPGLTAPAASSSQP